MGLIEDITHLKKRVQYISKEITVLLSEGGTVDLTPYQLISEKGQASGYASLNSSGKHNPSESIITQLGVPTLVGNTLVLKLIGENGIVQTQSISLSGLSTIDINVDSMIYNAASNIISLQETDGTLHTINLSEFSIVPSTDSNGVTTLVQEGITKATLSKVGQTGNYLDLLNKPTISTNITISSTPSTVVINSSNGTPGTINLANGINAGISTNDYTTSEKTKLASITGNNTGDNAVNTTANTYADGKIVQTISSGDTNHAPSSDVLYSKFYTKADFEEVTSTTLTHLDGGISINSTDNTKFDIPMGSGVILNTTLLGISKKPVSWEAFLSQTTPYLNLSNRTYIFIDKPSTIATIQLSQTKNRQYLSDYIYLGYIEHNGGQITKVVTEPNYNINLGSQFQQYIEDLGFFTVAGNTITFNGNLKLNMSSGITFKRGIGFLQNEKTPNHYSSNTINNIPIRYYHRSSGSWNYLSNVTDINSTQYDNNSVLTTIPTDKWIIQKIYFNPTLSRLDILHGQAIYNTKEEALANVSTPIETNPLLDNHILLYAIVIKSNASDLSDNTQCELKSLKEVTTASSNSTTPSEIITASNIGTFGVGIFNAKNVTDLEFKKIKPLSNKISIADNPVDKTVDINLNEANFTGIPQSAITGLTTTLASKEPLVVAGLNTQYYRGDKTWVTLDKSAVGLSNVTNVDTSLRSNHTGTQLSSTISDFNTAVIGAASNTFLPLALTVNTDIVGNFDLNFKNNKTIFGNNVNSINYSPLKTYNNYATSSVHSTDIEHEFNFNQGGIIPQVDLVGAKESFTVYDETNKKLSYSLYLRSGNNLNPVLNIREDGSIEYNINTLVNVISYLTDQSTTDNSSREFYVSDYGGFKVIAKVINSVKKIEFITFPKVTFTEATTLKDTLIGNGTTTNFYEDGTQVVCKTSNTLNSWNKGLKYTWLTEKNTWSQI